MLKKFLMSALFGLTALLLINVTAAYTGVYLPLSKLSLAVSGVLGIPGVMLMLLLQLVMG